jgi:hypothetical protein
MDKQHYGWLFVIFLVSAFLSYEFAHNAVGAYQLFGAISFIVSAVAVNFSFWIKARWTWKVILASFLLFLVNFFTIENDIPGRMAKLFGALFDAALHFK